MEIAGRAVDVDEVDEDVEAFVEDDVRLPRLALALGLRARGGLVASPGVGIERIRAGGDGRLEREFTAERLVLLGALEALLEVEGDDAVGAEGAKPLEQLHVLLPAFVRRETLLGARGEHGDRLVERVGSAVARGSGARPGHRVGQLVLAEFAVVLEHGGEVDVGGDAAQLGGAAGDAVEGGGGGLERAVPSAAQRQQRLHRALAVGMRIADDDGASVVLQGAGDDLGGGGADAVDQHDHGLRERDGGIVVVEGDRAARLADLDDRTGFEEEAGEVDGLGEGSAAVAAQVEDEALDVLGVEFGDEAGDVERGASLRGLGVVAELHARIERGQLDVAELARRAVGIDGGLDARGGGLLLELDLVAHEHDGLDRVDVVGGDDLDSHGAALGAADEADGLVERPVADVDEFLVALRDGDDLVAGDEAGLGRVALGGAAWDDLDDLGGAVVRLKRGADALERKLHVDPEILLRNGGEIAGVGVVRGGHRVEEAAQVELLVAVLED